MNLVIFALIGYIIVYFLFFVYVSKLNNCYINSWTNEMAHEIGVKLVPFLITISVFMPYRKAIWKMLAVMYVSLLFKFIGYQIGFRKQFRFMNRMLVEQQYARKRYGFYLVLSLIVGLIAFLILAQRGGGLYYWIFHNREAYISGRSGNGVWYLLFQLMITTMVALIFCMAERHKRKALLFVIPLIASYFTGSKGYIIGVVVSMILYYDMCVKKIKTIRMALIGIAVFGVLLILLQVQTSASLISYSDYYQNFLAFLNRQYEGGWEYTHGLITWEDFFWHLVPRSLYPNKPYVYGRIRVVALFYPEAAIKAGNTPSFSEYIIPYADFGLIGIAVYSFFENLFKGMIENRIRYRIYSDGCSFNLLYLYIILFFLTPVTFSIPYIMIFYVCFIQMQRIKLRWRN